MIYNVNQIIQQYNDGKPQEFLFFYSHRCERGLITKACFSQWYPCEFIVDGIRFHTAEQYMMSQKALHFKDAAVYKEIMKSHDPADYKALGRQVKGFSEAEWREVKYRTVLKGNLAKFSQNPRLGDFLLSTGKKILAEAAPNDTNWGIGMAADDPAIYDPNYWRGENLLGFALMETRDRLNPNADLVLQEVQNI